MEAPNPEIRTREHAVGTSQLTELASSGCPRRAQRVPAPESEAIQVDAWAAAAHVLRPALSRQFPGE